MKSVLIVISERDFQDKEYSGTREELEKAGISVTVASKTKGIKKGVFGSEVNAEISLGEVRIEEFSGIAFIGGGGASQYFNDKEALDLAIRFLKNGKAVSAICIAPILLAHAGILKGKKATVWDDGKRTQIGELERSGASCTGKDIEMDGNILTANGPKAAREFGKKLSGMVK